MLNRRSLRIKVMQNLFAFHQCRDADYELCLEKIGEAFKVDLNSMEVQDKELLAAQRKQAVKLFEKSFKKGEFAVEHEDDKLKNAVNDAFQFYTSIVKKDKDFFKKNLVNEIERIYDHYIAVLNLAVVFAELAAADKKVDHKNFVENAWIKALQSSDLLKKDALRLNKHWQNDSDQVKLWFRDVVRQDGEYQHYQDKKNPTLDDQKKFANHLFKRIILGKTVINDHFEEEVLRWAEDKDIVKGLVEKTVKSYDPSNGVPIALHTLSLNWEEDLDFLNTLFTRAITLDKKHLDLIANNTRNWEVDRLPLTDRIILEMAIAELITFPNIPVKVTINEYIELAKNYSTPNSRQFINGILDVIAKELKEAGSVKKSGRGLIDNK